MLDSSQIFAIEEFCVGRWQKQGHILACFASKTNQKPFYEQYVPVTFDNYKVKIHINNKVKIILLNGILFKWWLSNPKLNTAMHCKVEMPGYTAFYPYV